MGCETPQHATARLTLRPPCAADLPFIVDLFGRPEVVAHRPMPLPDGPEISRERLGRDMAHWREHGFGRWIAEDDGKPVGTGGVTRSDGFEGLNLSYHIHPDFWGRGYAGEIVAAALRFAFAETDADRVIGLARPANPASCRVLERAGLVFEREVDLHGAPTRLHAIHRDAWRALFNAGC